MTGKTNFKTEIMKEVFKDVQGYEGIYQVSNLGRVKSLKFSKEKIMKLSIDGGGYLKVNLNKDKEVKTYKVHKLVAINFLGHEPKGNTIVIDHINNYKIDNRANNLQLISHRENSTKDLKEGSSKYVGVSWNKKSKKFISKIHINGKNKFLGYFTNELEASRAYQKELKNL